MRGVPENVTPYHGLAPRPTAPTPSVRSSPTEQWQTVEGEDRQNRELLGLSQEIPSLVTEVHALSGATRREQTQHGR
jgi:hypothetical protein